MRQNGGPAFPARITLEHDVEQGKDYPNYEESGMTLRQWYAGQALAGYIASSGSPLRLSPDEEKMTFGEIIAHRSFLLADAMFAHEQKEQPK